MSEEQGPSIEEISGWRELLDGMGQLTVAWRSIEQSRAEADADDDIALPPELLMSLTRAAQDAAESLAGLAELITENGSAEPALLDTQREAAQQWSEAHDGARA